jgi:type VI secretion system secreted protein Hcp
MLKTKLVAAALTSAAIFVAAPAAHAADDYFLKIDGLAGEATAGSTKEAIAINSFELGIENTTSIGSATGGAGTGKATFQKLVVTKPIDSTSPLFFQRVGTGQHFTGMELVARKAGATSGGTTYMRWALQPVFVTKQEHSGSTGDDAPTETLTFVFGAMQQTFTKQTTTGAVTGNVIKVWNQVTNTDNPLVPNTTNTFDKSRFAS